MAAIISTLSALKKELGETVRIEGIYEEINGAQRPGKYIASGRAQIVLADGHLVALGTQEAGYRPKEELALCQGKKVQATGLYMGMQTLWGDGSQASIVCDALLGVFDVELV